MAADTPSGPADPAPARRTAGTVRCVLTAVALVPASEPSAAAGGPFDALVVLALLLAVAILARPLARAWVSTALVFVVAGCVTGPAMLGWFEVGFTTSTVHLVASLALATVLFSDAALTDLRVLRSVAAQPLRLLTVGLVLTIVLGTLLAMALLSPLTAALCLVVGTMLAPTDAALGAPVVTDEAVPADVRQVLSVESGLNDGLAVPVLLLALGWAGLGDPGAGFLRLLLVVLGLGAVIGAAIAALVAYAWLLATRRWGQTPTWSSLVPLLTAVLCYLASEEARGSGFIAAFVGGMVFGIVQRASIERELLVDESVSNLLQGAVWFVFGAMAVGPLLTSGSADWRWGVYALLSLTVVRMVPVWLSLLGTGQRPPTVAFMGWFGPRGLASVVFLVTVLDLGPATPDALAVTGVVTTTVLLSIVLHGFTAKPLAERYGSWAAAGGRG